MGQGVINLDMGEDCILRNILEDIFLLFGAALVTYGLWQYSPAIAQITLGVMLISAGLPKHHIGGGSK